MSSKGKLLNKPRYTHTLDGILPSNGILLNNKKEQIVDMCSKSDESQGHYTE